MYGATPSRRRGATNRQKRQPGLTPSPVTQFRCRKQALPLDPVPIDRAQRAVRLPQTGHFARDIC